MPEATLALLGGNELPTAYSLINDHWWRGLTAAGYEVLQTREQGRPRCVIHHDWQQKFSELQPLDVPMAAVRPWDFGPYPPAWVEIANTVCDQLWVHSRWVEKQALESGVDAERLRRVPLGFDPELFTPQGESLELATTKSFRFLFTGAAIQRKGIDVLVKAYGQAFAAGDDVCLVIKDHPNVFYQGISYRDQITAAQEPEDAPEILYLDHFLDAEELAALYRACDVGVFPYRAEGFCLPILEMLGSGRTVIAPDFGACLDYCDASYAELVPVKRICLPIFKKFATNTLGFEEDVTGVDFCEIKVDDLASRLRAVYETSRQELQARGALARERVRESFTWHHSVATVEKCVEELVGR